MTRTRSILLTLLALWLAALCGTAARAEGSRDLYPSGAAGSRANLFWSTTPYGGNLLLLRTLIRVYAGQGEYILVGSSGVGVGSGNILIYNPGRVSMNPASVGNETIPASPDFQAGSQAGKGQITSRALELAGPQSADGTQNTGGWAPAYYVAPSAGIYTVVFYGPSGDAAANEAATGSIGTVDTSTNQGTTVSAWDVTVRPSAASGLSGDQNGRVFTRYFAGSTGGGGRPIYSQIYACTTDGYQYRLNLTGLDPYRFILYGNQVGFYDSDHASPLYHDVLGNDLQLSVIQGGCSLALPSYPLFFHAPDTAALATDGDSTTPLAPSISALSFTGSGGSGGNNSRVGMGGTFAFTSNLSAVYEIVLSRNGTNFDPTLPANRRLRGVRAAGANTVAWDGKDNSGADFPIGTNYAVHATIHAGEYHFPFIDAENNYNGGPSMTLINPVTSNPLGNTVGFYDDRGYRTLSGFNATSDSSTSTSGTAARIGQPLGGINPPSPINTDPVNGAVSTGTGAYPAGFRSFGQSGNVGNPNTPNAGSFGDVKGLDQWTFFPSATVSSTLNVQGTPRVLLVKRITAVNGVAVSGFTDDPGTTDDNSAYWPSPASTYLRGALSGTRVQPGDIVEYTVYFVGTGGPATDFTLCDPVPADMTFQPDTDTGLTPGDGGAAGAPSGIALALSASMLPTAPTFFLTNGADGDRGQFYPPGTQAPPAANPPGYSLPLPAASNLGGVVAVAVVSSPTALPSATGAGTPTGSYGFVRFCAQVN